MTAVFPGQNHAILLLAFESHLEGDEEGQPAVDSMKVRWLKYSVQPREGGCSEALRVGLAHEEHFLIGKCPRGQQVDLTCFLVPFESFPGRVQTEVVIHSFHEMLV